MVDYYYGLSSFGLFSEDGRAIVAPLLGSGSQLEENSTTLTLHLIPISPDTTNMQLTLKLKAKGVSSVTFHATTDGSASNQLPIVVSTRLKRTILIDKYVV